ncbi:MAG TPA: flippase-like domain-containing protein [Chloroflexi bacterium]|nr:flippase-like domain-containing protein [Chloroflexota bacterium]
MKKPQRLPWRRALPGFIVSAAVLVVVFAISDPRTLWQALRSVPLWVLAAASVLLALSLVLRAISWQVLLGHRVKWADAFWALSTGYLINNIIPFRAGEAARAFLVAPKARVSFWHALSTVMVERLFDVVLLASMLVGSLPWVLDVPWARQAAWGFGGAALGVLIALAIIARYRARLAPALTSWQQRHAHFSWGKRLLHWALSFLDGLEALASPTSLTAVTFLLAASWGVQVAAYGLTLRALVPQASYLWAAFALGSVGMGVAVPSAPGGLGVVEGVMVFVLGVLGVGPSVALAYALAMHGIYYVVTGVLGWGGAMVYGVSLRGAFGQAQNWEKHHEAPE